MLREKNKANFRFLEAHTQSCSAVSSHMAKELSFVKCAIRSLPDSLLPGAICAGKNEANLGESPDLSFEPGADSLTHTQPTPRITRPRRRIAPLRAKLLNRLERQAAASLEPMKSAGSLLARPVPA